MNFNNINQNRYEEESNLLRSHYYLLKTRYDDQAVPIKVGDVIIFLHKNFRGYVPHKFTHKDFMSIIRVFGLQYFNVRCKNIKALLQTFKTFEDTMMIHVEDNVNNSKIKGLGVLLEDNKSTFEKQIIATTNALYKSFDVEKLKDRNIALYGTLKFEFLQQENSTFQFNIQKTQEENQTEDLNIVHFFKFINKMFNANVSNILQNPISAVFLEFTLAYEIYKIGKNLNVFIESIAPSLYDFAITNKIFNYIENIEHVNCQYTTPIK
ncbi:HgNV_049 [Dikerogammarus haemobaphes nudivirus]|nr:HgNV_049 [Dikerogammarus haemobaphes nudivirus]